MLNKGIKDLINTSHKDLLKTMQNDFVEKKFKSYEKGENKKIFDKKIKKIEKLKGTKYPIIDSHVHVVDFLGETEGLKNLLYYMDKGNIEKAVIFGTSMKKIWSENERERPEYYLDDDNPCYYDSSTDTIVASEYQNLSTKEKERFFPLLCGFNPMDIDAVKYIERTMRQFPGVFCGIGEILYRHDDLTFQTFGEPPRMNTKATEKILEFASLYDLPILIHNNITSPTVDDYPKYLHELETMLRKFPRAKVVFAHCGASRRLNSPYYVKMIDRLLTEYPSLYVDFSWVIFDDIIAINDVSMGEWIELSEKFADRIMIGSDILGNGFHKIGTINSKYNDFLDMLSEETRKKICTENALNLFSKSRNKLENNKKIKFPKLEDIKL